MDNIPLMQIPNRIQDLIDRLRGILFRKLSILANAIKQFSSGREFRHNIIFILSISNISLHPKKMPGDKR